SIAPPRRRRRDRFAERAPCDSGFPASERREARTHRAVEGFTGIAALPKRDRQRRISGASSLEHTDRRAVQALPRALVTERADDRSERRVRQHDSLALRRDEPSIGELDGGEPNVRLAIADDGRERGQARAASERGERSQQQERGGGEVRAATAQEI